MWTSQARTSPENSDCQSSSMISRRLKTWPGRSARSRSTWNSERVRLIGSARTVTRWRARSMETSPASMDWPAAAAVAGDAIELPAAQLGADAAEQLADAEGLGDVVVGADLEADDLVDLGVLGREQDDRDGAAAANLAADVEARAARHHDVEDEQIEGDVAVAELAAGVVAIGGDGDVEALLTQRVADRLADRGLVVSNEDATGGHR